MEKIECSTCGKLIEDSRADNCVHCGAAQSQVIKTKKKLE